MNVVANAIYYNPVLALQQLQLQGRLQHCFATWFQVSRSSHGKARALIYSLCPDSCILPKWCCNQQIARCPLLIITPLGRVLFSAELMGYCGGHGSVRYVSLLQVLRCCRKCVYHKACSPGRGCSQGSSKAPLPEAVTYLQA